MRHSKRNLSKLPAVIDLYVKTCPIKGRCVLTRNHIEKGEMFLTYEGRLCTEEPEGDDTYVFMFAFKGKTYWIDATVEDATIGQLLNDSEDPNCKVKVSSSDGVPFLAFYSIKEIHKDEEIVYNYGPGPYPWRIKICDFGIVNITQPLRAGCQLEDCCCQGLYSACPPWIAWTAPEVLEHPNSQESEGYITKAADVYSYAVVMWELVMCDDPYDDMNTAQEVMDYVISGGRPEIPEGTKMLRHYSMLMKKCWDGNPNERLSFKQRLERDHE